MYIIKETCGMCELAKNITSLSWLQRELLSKVMPDLDL
jgi:hypothetical protein